MIQILINYYNESIELVERLLKSIEKQERISFNDYEVLLYSDGSNTIITEDFLNSFSFSIIYKELPHRGVCATRNSLMDDSTAEYIMFCDADDYFHSSLGLHKLLDFAKLTNADIIGSAYEEEIIENNKIFFLRKEKDTMRVHGKIFKREYLIKNNIRFPNEMPYSGDMYFLWLAYNLSSNFIWLKDSFYVWSWNPNSITRKNKYHRLISYPILIKNYLLLIQNLTARKRFDLKEKLILSLTQMMFLNSTNKAYITGPKIYQNNMYQTIKSFIKKYGQIYNDFPDEKIKKQLYDINLKIHKEDKNCGGFNAIPQWINKIREE